MTDSFVSVRKRITIMDGEVRMFARGFADYQTAGGTRYEANGPFYISASRNQVVVHFCELRDERDFVLFNSAMEMAMNAMRELKARR